LYKSVFIKSYIFGCAGFIIGLKLCDLIFYDPQKHLLTAEIMED